VILADREALVRKIDNGRSVAVFIKVVWSREHGDYRWEFFLRRFTEKGKAIVQLAYKG
jgi:hypothetical protein